MRGRPWSVVRPIRSSRDAHHAVRASLPFNEITAHSTTTQSINVLPSAVTHILAAMRAPYSTATLESTCRASNTAMATVPVAPASKVANNTATPRFRALPCLRRRGEFATKGRRYGLHAMPARSFLSACRPVTEVEFTSARGAGPTHHPDLGIVPTLVIVFVHGSL